MTHWESQILTSVFFSPGHSRSLGTGFLTPCDKLFFPDQAPQKVFLIPKPPRNSFTVLLVSLCPAAKTLSLLLSPARHQVFSLLTLGGTGWPD